MPIGREEEIVQKIVELLINEFNRSDAAELITDLPRLASIGVVILSNYEDLSGISKKTILVVALQEICPNDAIDLWIPTLIDTLAALIMSDSVGYQTNLSCPCIIL